MIDYYEPKLDVTLLGCGFLGGYHLGALCALQQIWPQKPYERLCGASCGGLLGALLLAGLKLEVVLDNAMDIVRQLRAFIRNPMLLRQASIAGLLEQKLELLLPKNAHELCSNRLGLSLTKARSLENKFVSQFDSRQELIGAIQAGCFIPAWSGSLRVPEFKGEACMDGAYSDNSPRFPDSPAKGNDEDDSQQQQQQQQRQLDDDDGTAKRSNRQTIDQRRHVDICAFSAYQMDVSPKDRHHLGSLRVFGHFYKISWNNLWRMLHAIMPVNVETYLEYVINGHQDMIDYIFRNDLVKCRDCYNNRNSDTKQQDKIRIATEDINRRACLACLQLMERIDSLVLPPAMYDIFVDYNPN